MTSHQKRDRGLTLLKRLLRIHVIGSTITQKLIEEYENDPTNVVGSALVNLLGSEVANPESLYRQPIIDHGAMAVVWAGRSCHLGNTRLLRVMERLARRPNQYVSFERLLRDAWDGDKKSDEAIRNVVHRLKQELRAAGMFDLAAAIRSAGRSYGLILD